MVPLFLLLMLACPAWGDLGSPIPIPPPTAPDALGWWTHQGERAQLRFLYRGNECLGWVDTETREYFAWTGRVYYRAMLPVGAPPLPPSATRPAALPTFAPMDCPT